MDLRDFNVQEIILSICNSNSFNEAYTIYKLAMPLLVDYKFVFASTRGGEPGFALNRTFSAGASVRSLFKADRILVLDPNTAFEMQSGQAIYPIDYSISLDTNAMSYLVPYIAGKRNGRIPADFKDVFEFIARPEVYVDPIPYFTENLPNLENDKAASKIFENLKAYEILRTIDVNWLKLKGKVHSTLSDHDLIIATQRLISQMYFDSKNEAAMKGLVFRHQYMYACLIKMATIQLSSPNRDIGQKMAAFLKFCHTTLATMSVREAAVARAYFTHGQNLKFFGKIQKGRDDILKLLSNMAWDMWHIRQLELSITFKPNKQARYFFPALLTFDKNFIEIMDLYPLKACAFKTGSSHPMPFFDGDPFRLIATNDEDGVSVIKEYFSSSAISAREAVRDNVKVNFLNQIRALEAELLAVGKN